MRFIPEAHIEIQHSDHFSIQTSGVGLSVEVWIKPIVFTYAGEGEKKHIHWLGKGKSNKMEWGFRLYSSDHPERPNESQPMRGILRAAKVPVPISAETA
ncbi:MAG UNVERIFIED_CONTAM: hypothetical protein LVR18_16530 [Planctomycetaceae bacterium]